MLKIDAVSIRKGVSLSLSYASRKELNVLYPIERVFLDFRKVKQKPDEQHYIYAVRLLVDLKPKQKTPSFIVLNQVTGRRIFTYDATKTPKDDRPRQKRDKGNTRRVHAAKK